MRTIFYIADPKHRFLHIKATESQANHIKLGVPKARITTDPDSAQKYLFKKGYTIPPGSLTLAKELMAEGTLRLKPERTPLSSLSEMPTPQRIEQKTAQEIMQDPVVKQAVDLYGGTVIEVEKEKVTRMKRNTREKYIADMNAVLKTLRASKTSMTSWEIHQAISYDQTYWTLLNYVLNPLKEYGLLQATRTPNHKGNAWDITTEGIEQDVDESYENMGHPVPAAKKVLAKKPEPTPEPQPKPEKAQAATHNDTWREQEENARAARAERDNEEKKAAEIAAAVKTTASQELVKFKAEVKAQLLIAAALMEQVARTFRTIDESIKL